MGSRLFVSVDLPDRLAAPVADLQAVFDGAPGLNFVEPAQAHLTLKFLGDVRKSAALSSQSESHRDSDDVDDDRVPELESELATAVAGAGVAPFTARLGGLGVFPSLEYVRVLWLGIEDGGDEFRRLHEALEERTTAMGFDPEGHEFTPHVTLGRMEHAGGKELVQRLVRDAEHGSAVGEFRVEEVRLTESTLTPDGPAYATLERFPLE